MNTLLFSIFILTYFTQVKKEMIDFFILLKCYFSYLPLNNLLHKVVLIPLLILFLPLLVLYYHVGCVHSLPVLNVPQSTHRPFSSRQVKSFPCDSGFPSPRGPF